MWIKTVRGTEMNEELRKAMQEQSKLYPSDYGVPVAALRETHQSEGSITTTHSLLPTTLQHAFATYGTLLSPELPLTRIQQEMIATVVSRLNDCYY